MRDEQTLGFFFDFKELIIRPMREDDLEVIVPLINEGFSYQENAKGEPRTTVTKMQKRMKEVNFYVVEDRYNLLGCVYLEDKGKTLHFGLLTVHKKWRGAGLAPAIMRSIEQYAQSNGYKIIELDYMSLASWLKKYYEDYGFHATGEITPWGNINLVRMIKKI